jgi:hypothetical protein
VRRYLEYHYELKKIYKIDEKELLLMLNENLRNKIIVYLHGQLLQNISVLGKFPIELLS